MLRGPASNLACRAAVSPATALRLPGVPADPDEPFHDDPGPIETMPGSDLIRASVHYFDDEDEIDRLVAAVRDVVKPS